MESFGIRFGGNVVRVTIEQWRRKRKATGGAIIQPPSEADSCDNDFPWLTLQQQNGSLHSKKDIKTGTSTAKRIPPQRKEHL
ncbi:hypothetical protein IV203_037364 [Nitzschia inconspicua]|uniref:Uncharacterized protein n=1 Tax=Nitzschia inconspicua TaxID=303405 RepID=A0A9K3LL75_9STRA|nr:hypothetical protein IV203_037364 [Nitzschia inconspicua]